MFYRKNEHPKECHQEKATETREENDGLLGKFFQSSIIMTIVVITITIMITIIIIIIGKYIRFSRVKA